MAATSEDDEMKGLNDLEKEMESHEEDDDDEDDDDSSSSSSKSSTRSQGERRTSFSVPGGKGEECEGLMAGQYRMGKLIGRGGFGTVHKALNVNTGQIVAIKRFHAAKITKSKLAAVMAEADVLEKLNHSNVVKFIGYVKTQDFLHLVLEYVEEGALSDVLKDYGRFPENITALYTAQMLKGLAYLHEQRVIHRDIKGANVLLTKDGGIKLTDFGVAAVINESEKRFSVVGTPYWMAPEVIEVAGHSTKSDIWSVGSTVYQLIMGEPPHFDLQPLAAMYRIVKERRPPLPKPCSDELADFLSKCWNKEPSKRPSAKELLSHPWITNAVPPESKPEQVVLPPEELKTSLKTHNSVVIHRASVSSDQHSDREDDNEDDDGRGDTMYISSSYPCIESESEDENGEKIPRMPSSEQEMEEWEREGRRTARSSSTSGVPTTNLSSGNSKRKSGSSVRRMTAAMKSHSSDAEEMNRKREKAERERRERERRREEKMEKKEKKREEKIRLKESRESMRMQQKEKEDKALKKSFSKYTVDSEERPICQNGLACNSDDAEHFLKFRHTPLTTPPTAEKDKTIIFLSSSSDGFERLDKSDSDSARNSSEIKTSTPDKPYAAMWKKLEDALYDNGKLRSRNDELEQEVERVMGQRDDLLIQLAEMRSYTDEVLALANMVLSADHNGKKEKEAKLKKILQTLVDEKPKRTQSHEELLISVASELKANKKKKEKKVKKDKSPKKPGTGVTSTGGAAAGDDKEKREASEKRTGDVISSEMSASRKKYTSIVDVAGKELAEEHQHLRHLSNEMISDPEGKDFWLKLFGAEAFYVKWDEFIEELSKALGVSISKDDQALMKHVLDNSGTGHINMYKWSEFLKGFGPLTNVVNNVRNILTAPWFHGFLTSREAELLLEDQPIGTFLIRFSRSSGGSFALAFVQEHRKILHILIQSCMPEGFKIDEEEGDKSKYFESLQDIVDHYSIFLQHSFTSELPRESWFHGDVSPPEAIELLQGHPEGTFLIRFSSQPGCFAASFMASHSEVRHALIQGLPQGGFLFAGEKETFPNLTTLIEAYSPTLRFALPNNETDVAPILKKYLESKKAMKEAEDRGPIPNHYSAVDTETFKKVLGGRK